MNRVIGATRLLPVILLLLAPAACASGGASGGMAGQLSWDVGLATPGDLSQRSIRVLDSYQYQVEREDGPPNIYILTRWQQRLPFEDERARGAQLAQTRFIVEARPRQRNQGRDDLFTVRVRAENRLQLEGGDSDWQLIEPTPEFREFAGTVAEGIRAALEAGIRVFGPGAP